MPLDFLTKFSGLLKAVRFLCTLLGRKIWRFYALTAVDGALPKTAAIDFLRMSIPDFDRVTPEKRRVGYALAAIFFLHMLNLFLILPAFLACAKMLPCVDILVLGTLELTQSSY